MTVLLDGFLHGAGFMLGCIVVFGAVHLGCWLFERLNPDLFNLD